MEPEETQAIEGLIRKAQEAMRRHRERVRVRGRLAMALLSLLFLADLFFSAEFGFKTRIYIAVVAAFVLLTGLLSLFTNRTDRLGRPTLAHRNLLLALARSADARAIGPLAAALDFTEEGLSGRVAEALIRLLPRLRREDADLLDATQRLSLYRRLGSPYPQDIGLQLAILQMIEQVGDAQALPFVESLAVGKRRVEADPALREAAERGLPLLRERLERDRTGRSLLRATETPIDAPDILLHSVPVNDEAQPDQLLRSTFRETDSPNA